MKATGKHDNCYVREGEREMTSPSQTTSKNCNYLFYQEVLDALCIINCSTVVKCDLGFLLHDL